MGRSHKSDTRHAPNVGVGTIKHPLSEKDTPLYNAGWDMFEDMGLNVSTKSHRDFEVIPIQQSKEFGPHIFVLNPGDGEYLDPGSVYLKGKVKVVHYQANQNNHDAALPRHETKLDMVPDTQRWNITTDAGVPDGIDVYRHVDIPTDPVTHVYMYPGSAIPQLHGNANYPKRANIAPCNLFPQALFKDVIVKIQNQTITQSSNAQYGYKAYLENLLSYSPNALDTHLKTEMWEPTKYWDFNRDNYNWGDVSSRATQGAPFFNHREAWHTRRQAACNDRNFDFQIKLHTEFSSINRFLPDKAQYQFEFIRAEPQFCLIGDAPEAGAEYRIQLSDLRLCGRYMMPSIECNNHFQLDNMPAFSYGTTRTQLLSSIINQGVTAHMFSNVFTNGDLPEQMYMFMVPSAAYQGAYNHDPFCFNDYNVGKVYLQIDGKQYPTKALEPEFRHRDTMTAYAHLQENIGLMNKNAGISITKDMFDAGYTIFAWDLTPDKCAGDHMNHISQTGTVNLFLEFRQPVHEQVQCVVVAVYKDKLILDKFRNPVVLDASGEALRAP